MAASAVIFITACMGRSANCSLTVTECQGHTGYCEIDNLATPPVCRLTRCAVGVDECPSNAGCEVRLKGTVRYCSPTLSQMICSATQATCGDPSAGRAQCEWDAADSRCNLINFPNRCLAYLHRADCLADPYCDIHPSSGSCRPSVCTLIGSGGCVQAEHCEWDTPRYTCVQTQGCERHPLRQCIHGALTNCGWDGSECASCSGAGPADCHRTIGCEWHPIALQCMSLRHSCARHAPEGCDADPLCSRSPNGGCVLHMLLPEAAQHPRRACEERTNATCGGHCALDAAQQCTSRDPATWCPTLDPFACASHTPCWWDAYGRACRPHPDYCSFEATPEGCDAASSLEHPCTWVANARRCSARLPTPCSSAGDADSCAQEWCAWNPNASTCATVVGCAGLPRSACDGWAGGAACYWGISGCQGDRSRSPSCGVLDLGSACGGTECLHLHAPYRGKRVAPGGALPHGWMGVHYQHITHALDVDAKTRDPICSMAVGGACYVCEPPYVVDPYARASCLVKGGEAALDRQLCTLPSSVCRGNFTDCTPVVGDVVTPLSGAAAGPALCLLVAALLSVVC